MTTTISASAPPAPSHVPPSRVAWTALTALVPMVWGTTYIVTTRLLPDGHPLFAALVRSLPAGVIALLATRQLPRGSWWWKSVVLGTLNMAAFFPLLFVAAQHLPGGVAATLGAAQPIVVAFLAAAILHERLSTWRVWWGVVGVVGVALVVLGPSAGLDAIGILAGLGGAVSMGTGVVLTKKWGRPAGVSAISLAGWQLTAAGLVLLVPALLVDGVPAGIDGGALLGHAWLGLIGALVAYTIWFSGIRHLPVTATALLGLLSPLVAAALGAGIAGEALNLVQLAGFVLALTAMVLGQLPSPTPRAAVCDDAELSVARVGDMSAPPFDPTGLEPRSATDEQREAGPIARSPEGTWVILGRDEAEEVADDDVSFSSAVSRFLQVPNGLDGDEHAAFRAATDHFFSPDEMAAFEPTLRRIAKDLVGELTVDVGAEGTEVDAVAAIGAVFAVRAQTAWLGWPSELETELLQWMIDNHEASRSRQLERTAEVAARFDTLIRSVIEPRRAAGEYAPDDVTTRLLRQRVHLADPEVPGSTDRALRDDEVVSILRNWTGGDLGSLALCVGVLLMALSTMPQLVHRLRVGTYEEAVAITDELLRIDSPFVSNRRVATCPATVAGHEIAEGDRLLIHWTSANRDERTFSDPDAFDPETNAPRNLVYGTGAHVCPGRPLATLELVVALQEILAVADVSPAPTAGEREIAPVGGWASAPIVLTPRP